MRPNWPAFASCFALATTPPSSPKTTSSRAASPGCAIVSNGRPGGGPGLLFSATRHRSLGRSGFNSSRSSQTPGTKQNCTRTSPAFTSSRSYGTRAWGRVLSKPLWRRVAIWRSTRFSFGRVIEAGRYILDMDSRPRATSFHNACARNFFACKDVGQSTPPIRR